MGYSAADQRRAAAERSIGARIAVAVTHMVARIGAAGLLEVEAAPAVAHIAVDTAAAGLLGSGAGSGAAPVAAHNYFEAALVHPGARRPGAHQGTRSGMEMVSRLGCMPSRGTVAAHSHSLQTRARAPRRRSVSKRSFSFVRESCGKSLGEAFDSGGGKAAPRTKHADSFRDSWFLSVHSDPLKHPSSGPSEMNGAETNGDRTARGEGLVQRPGP